MRSTRRARRIDFTVGVATLEVSVISTATLRVSVLAHGRLAANSIAVIQPIHMVCGFVAKKETKTITGRTRSFNLEGQVIPFLAFVCLLDVANQKASMQRMFLSSSNSYQHRCYFSKYVHRKERNRPIP